MRKKILFLLLGITLYSCDPGVSYKRIIENNSSYNIYLKIGENSFTISAKDSFSVPKNTEQVIYAYHGLGQRFKFENCSLPDSSIIGGLINNDSLALTKDLNAEQNWNFTVLEESYKEGGDCECRLIIGNADIN